MKKYISNISPNNFSIFFLLCFPAFLVAGPLMAEIAMNSINFLFLYKIFKEKNFSFLKEKFFIIFILFYLYIFLTIIFSNYVDKIFFKHIFYFRHILFIFAVANLLSINKNLIFLFYKILLVTILIVSLDGIIQFIFDYNLLGNEKIREDRLTGFFDDKMVLGSYIARLLPLLLGLFIYNFKFLNKKNLIFSFFTILISFTTIMLSGERMAFLSSITYVLMIFILLNFSKKIKLTLIIFVVSIVTITISFSPTLMDRHLQQTKDQVNFKFDHDTFFSNFQFYKDIYQTAFNGFLDRNIIGQGARSFRYFCSEENLKSVSIGKVSRNVTVHKATVGGGYVYNNIDPLYIANIYFDSDTYIQDGDVLFTFLDADKNRIDYISDFNGYLEATNLFIWEDKHIKLNDIWFVTSFTWNGCTTHPHNFYLQLLGETGIIGFLFVFLLFGYLIYLVCKNFISSKFKNKIILSNFQICLLVGFIVTLLPVLPNGNFFNNWLSMLMYLPVGFYIYSTKKMNKK